MTAGPRMTRDTVYGSATTAWTIAWCRTYEFPGCSQRTITGVSEDGVDELIEFRVTEQDVPVLPRDDSACIRPAVIVRTVEVAGQEDVQSYPEPGRVVPQNDLVEDVVMLAQPQQLRPLGQLEQDLADELPLFVSKHRGERLARHRFHGPDVVPVERAQRLDNRFHLHQRPTPLLVLQRLPVTYRGVAA